MCANHASRLCECCAAEPRHSPIGRRATSGTRPWPPNMKRAFAAWLTISSMAQSAKSTTRISTTGFSPASAIPTAGADDRRLRDRRVDHARGAELLLQALVLLEDAAAPDVLADDYDIGVTAHGIAHGRTSRLSITHQRHCSPPVSWTSR